MVRKNISMILTIIAMCMAVSVARELSVYQTVAEENDNSLWTLCAPSTDGDSIYRYSIDALNKSAPKIDFAKHKGKPMLLVNVATYCGSAIEYPYYNQLAEKYGDKLVIVAFPSDNFLNQEPSSDPDEIYNAIKYVRPGKGFVPKFPLSILIQVNGKEEHPIYSYLKRSCASTRTGFMDDLLTYRGGKSIRDIRWNFEKFLIHPKTGMPYKRYDQMFTPDRIIPDIEHLLSLK